MRNKRIGLFVDVSNLIISTKQASGSDARVKFEGLLEYALSQGNVLISAAYTSWNPALGDYKLAIKLKLLGYTHIVLRSVKQLPDGRLKANCDNEMAFDIGQAVLRGWMT